MTMYTVYEIETKGGSYIGVTGRSLTERLRELRCTRGFDGKIGAIAAFDNRADALALERELRPDYRMGLNRGKGGERSGGGSQRFGATNPSALQVRVAGVEYPAMIDAAKALGVKNTTVHYRLGSPYFPDWEYVAAPHAHYWQNDFARKRRIPSISSAYHRRAM